MPFCTLCHNLSSQPCTAFRVTDQNTRCSNFSFGRQDTAAKFVSLLLACPKVPLPLFSASERRDLTCTLVYSVHSTQYAINLLELENIVWIHYYCFHFRYFRKALRPQRCKLSKGSPYYSYCVTRAPLLRLWS